jgi:protein involved in polysaccharide export with SLBB domain
MRLASALLGSPSAKVVAHFLCIAVLVGLVPGCASNPPPRFDESMNFSNPSNVLNAVTVTNQLSPELLRPPTNLFTLGPGDSIDIEILGNPTSRVLTTVGLDSKIYYQLLPGVDVGGLTLEQTRELLEKELANYVRSPQVALTLRTNGSKHIWMLGRLARPGIYPITGSMSLLESLALAGGTARSTSSTETGLELADLQRSFIVRDGQFLPVNFYRLLRLGDTTQNIALQPDDFIYVPSSLVNEVYVLGSVRNPRAVGYFEQMTLVSAIAAATGPQRYDLLARDDPGPFAKDANVSHVALLRGSLSEPQVTVVDYNAIVKGRAADVPLEPGDIIYVPNSPYTTLKRYVNLIVNTFVTTLAANEGVRAAGGQVSVSPSVPVGGTR